MVDISRKNIIVRADGNAQIGVGHLMRCLTIAEALEHRSRVGFVCAEHASAKLVQEKGFDAYVLGTDYKDMEAELPLWKELFGRDDVLLQEGNRPVFLVDSYYVTNGYLEGLKAYGRVVLLDDMCKQSWSVDFLVNYNAFATEEMYLNLQSPYGTKYYVGSKYVPIRQAFCGREYEVKNRVEHILITTGGGDIDNIAGQILDGIWCEACSFHVVTGRFNPHYENLCEKARLRGNIHIYHDVQDMAGLMARCDLAVTAGGTTIYELSALGVPFVCFSYAENQEKLTEYIGRMEPVGFGGAYHKDKEQTLENIRLQVERLRQEKELRRKYSAMLKMLVDGKGAARIAELLQKMAGEND